MSFIFFFMFDISYIFCLYGPYIKYVGEGREGGEYWRMLMGHETLFKIFDGLQNIISCSVFVIFFFRSRGLKHKTSKLAIKEI